MWTVCHEPDCPETIPVESCWCWEHLATGCESCSHPAHDCGAPEHYCPEHREES